MRSKSDNMQLLLVEDDRELEPVIVSFLEDDGYAVERIETGPVEKLPMDSGVQIPNCRAPSQASLFS